MRQVPVSANTAIHMVPMPASVRTKEDKLDRKSKSQMFFNQQPESLLREFDEFGQLAEVIVHQGDVSSFNRSIGTGSAHGKNRCRHEQEQERH